MPPLGLQEAAGGTGLEGANVGFIDEEMGTEAMQAAAGPGRSRGHRAAAKAGLGKGAQHGSPRGADRHPPPTSGASGCDRRALHITAARQHRGRTAQAARHWPFHRLPGSRQPQERQTKFPVFKLNRESEMAGSLVITPVRPPPPCSTEYDGRGAQTRGRGVVATSSSSQASPSAPVAHSYLLQRAACCPCCGGTL